MVNEECCCEELDEYFSFRLQAAVGLCFFEARTVALDGACRLWRYEMDIRIRTSFARTLHVVGDITVIVERARLSIVCNSPSEKISAKVSVQGKDILILFTMVFSGYNKNYGKWAALPEWKNTAGVEQPLQEHRYKLSPNFQHSVCPSQEDVCNLVLQVVDLVFFCKGPASKYSYHNSAYPQADSAYPHCCSAYPLIGNIRYVRQSGHGKMLMDTLARIFFEVLIAAKKCINIDNLNQYP